MISAKDLSEEEVETIRRLAEEGATLGEIQKGLTDDFQLSMTYLEARMLIGDLGVELRGEEKPEEPEEEEVVEESASEEAGGAEDASADLAEDEPAASEDGDAVAANVTVTMSELVQPGMIASGGVTFTDGESAEWYVDEMGRLGLNPATEGYRPSEADVGAFQNELQKLAPKEGI